MSENEGSWQPKTGERCLYQPQYLKKGFKRPVKAVVVFQVGEDGWYRIKIDQRRYYDVKIERLRPLP